MNMMGTTCKCTYLDFPGIIFQVAKNHVKVDQEGEAHFNSEVKPPAPATEETKMDAIPQVTQQQLIRKEE